MKRSYLWVVVVLCIACLSLAACGETPTITAAEDKPAKVEHLEGPAASRVTLTEDAAKRLDIQTTAVRDVTVSGVQREVIPYSAVLYDAQGNTWTYTASNALTFIREPIKVDHVEGDQAILSEGPASGTPVVTVGAEELFGSETEFQEE